MTEPQSPPSRRTLPPLNAPAMIGSSSSSLYASSDSNESALNAESDNGTRESAPPPSHAAAAAAAAASATAQENINIGAIKKLNENDVLMGRGPGLTGYEGNIRFRDLCDEREVQYKTTTNRKEKKRIAKEVLDIVHSRGGRFLKQDGDIKHFDDWFEAPESVAMEKCKQALRELRGPATTTQRTRPASDADSAISASTKSTSPVGESVPSTSVSGSVHYLQKSTDKSSVPTPPSSLPATISPSGGVPSLTDPRLSLFSGYPLLFQQQQATGMFPQRTTTNPFLFPPVPSRGDLLGQGMSNANIASIAARRHSFVENVAMQSMLRDFALLQTQSTAALALQNEIQRRAMEEKLSALLLGEHISDERNAPSDASAPCTNGTMVVEKPSTLIPLEDQTSVDEAEEEEVAAFLLSSMALVDRPMMTAEQEAEEKATLTDREKASILADAFGDMRVSSSHKSKKARREMDENSVAFLLRQMVIEVEKIPANRRSALTEALSKAGAEEFSVKRLERFLRVEGMNAKLAAERLAKYWEARLQTFGPDKFTMKMSLGGALRDDLVALETCVYTQLPNDASGRTVLYMEPHRHTRRDYASESMLRAIWYVSEIAAHENTDVNGGIVQVCWFHNASLFDYDLTVFDRWAYYLSNCWPLKLLSNHLCCPTTISRRIVIPIVHTLVSRDWRARTLIHDVPVEDIIGVLSQYGISKDILPTETGGLLQSHQREWIAHRRAIEMEEL